jgi:hypothetical protein
MPEAEQLARKRTQLLEELAGLHYFRPGSISPLLRRCGKRACRCSRPNDPGHGPNLRLTYKIGRKTYSESLPTFTAVRRAEREIAEYRRFQELTRAFVEVNLELCRLRARKAREQRSQALGQVP